MRARLALVAALGAALLGASVAAAEARLEPCGSGGVFCGTVTVPLDYAGVVPGSVALHVEEVPAAEPVRGAVLLVAGGPGQPSTRTFDLDVSAPFWRRLFPGYTLVAYDDRGTGGSGPLSCAGLSLIDTGPAAGAVGLCGALLGAAAPFYATRDHAEDMEAVRRELGFDRLALWGASYGTKQVLGYAIAHPDRVERLVLDSVDRPDGPDPFATDILRAIPLGFASICRDGACRAVTADPAGDLARVANQLAARPLGRLDGIGLLHLAVGADLSAGLAAELPSAVAAAASGRWRSLLRLFALAAPGGVGDDINQALEVATVCDDGPFPWPGDAAVGARQGAIDAALAALPAGATGPFGPWATALGTAADCTEWPAPAGSRALAPGPLPDVPTLVLAGDRDMRTPLAGSAAVAAKFPRGRLIVAPGVGHDVTGSSACVDRALRDWLDGATPPASCPRLQPAVAPVGPVPRSVASLVPIAPVRGRAGRTLAAVAWTLHEARAASLFSFGARGSLTGLEGGTLAVRAFGGMRLSSYSDVRGVTLTGRVGFAPFEGPTLSSLDGELRVGGRAAVSGELRVVGARLSGVLGGRRVSVRLRS